MRILFFFIGILCISSQSNTKEGVLKDNESGNRDAIRIAVHFMNDYIEFQNDPNSNMNIIEWVERRSEVTDSFKIALKRLIDQAKAENPGVGLGFDPILDAQDSPERMKYSSQSGDYIILKGVDWPSFKVVLKMKENNGELMIDGAGMVNIPEDISRR